MSNAMLAILTHYASLYGLSTNLVLSVVEVESNHNQSKIGELGEVGLFQLRPEYYTPFNLHDTKINIRLGIRHLAKAKQRCEHQEDNTWLVCYNAGITGGSKIKNPKQFPYYKKVMEVYNRRLNERHPSILFTKRKETKGFRNHCRLPS